LVRLIALLPVKNYAMQHLPALFLDRDGVLNRRLPGRYVTSPAEFEWLPQVPEALAWLAQHFAPIVVVTNQAGIGKGLMTEADLAQVHAMMRTQATAAGGRIDAVYHAPTRADEGSPLRKPATGMAELALREFPSIDFAQAWMVGDSVSDIEFGQAMGMKTALIEGKMEEKTRHEGLQVDWRGPSLWAFAEVVCGW
jgi:histidinol-phosphate phosphatase family protein